MKINTFARLSLGLVTAALVLSLAGAPSAVALDDKPKTTEKDHGKDHKDHKDHDHANDKSKDKSKEAKGAKVGEKAPEFTLKDVAGAEVKLADLNKDGTIVVIEWFNPDCPFIVKHHEKNTTFADLHTKYSDKKVKFVAINSSAAGKEGYGQERNMKAKTDWKIAYPILLDESGAIGKAYGAKTTPHCFVIDKNGVLAYQGAIDDNKSPTEKGKTNYVANALDNLLAGKAVETSETKPYGCSVKYGT